MFSAVLQGGGTLESTRIHTFSPLMGKSESFNFWAVLKKLQVAQIQKIFCRDQKSCQRSR